jgi:hypothetical protein
MKLPSVCVYVQVSLLLFQKGIKLETLPHDSVLVNEVKLIKYVHKVYLIALFNLSLDD